MIIFAGGIAWALDGLEVQLAGNAGPGSIVDMEFREYPFHALR
jgi:hypothetical protein